MILPYVPLSRFAKDLDPRYFLQCSRSTIVNRRYISSVDTVNNYISLKRELGRLDIGRVMKSEFMNRLRSEWSAAMLLYAKSNCMNRNASGYSLIAVMDFWITDAACGYTIAYAIGTFFSHFSAVHLLLYFNRKRMGIKNLSVNRAKKRLNVSAKGSLWSLWRGSEWNW